MIAEIITSKLIDKVWDEFWKKCSKFLNKKECSINLKKDNLKKNLRNHQKMVKAWCEQISFADLKRARKTKEVYVALDIYLNPRRVRSHINEEIEVLTLQEFFNEKTPHFALLGQVGAGKTTCAKYFAHKIQTDKTFFPDKFEFPIVIKLRDLSPSKNFLENKNEPIVSGLIFDELASILELSISYDNDLKDEAKKKEIEEKIILDFLDESKALLILDGFDELNYQYEDYALKEIQKLIQKLSKTTVLLTCRTGGFPYKFDQMHNFEIRPLTQSQVLDFAKKWLGKTYIDFLNEIKKSPFADTTIRPLTLVHLCAIYEKSGYIPQQPKSIYKRIVNLLLYEWDEQRAVKRKSKYALFEMDKKYDFLCALAFNLTTEIGKNIFDDKDLIAAFKYLHQDFDLELRDAKKVISEIESHNGLFTQAGYDFYEFSHKSLQEFLTAEYLVKLPKIPNIPDLIHSIPNELAVAVSISSNPSYYLSELVFNYFNGLDNTKIFISSFVDRLIQERPEFNSSDSVIIAMFTLYGIYLDNGSQMHFGFHYDKKSYSLIDEFETILLMSYKRNSQKTIAEYYNVNHLLNSENQEEKDIYFLTRKEDKNLKEYEIPGQLCLRSTFFNKIFLDEKKTIT